MIDLPQAELSRLADELEGAPSPADLHRAKLMEILTGILADGDGSDRVAGLRSVLVEIEALEPGSLALMQASLERRRLRLGLGDRAVQQ